MAVNRIRCDDMGAHIYKTTDGGNSWQEIINGLPAEPINVVREDAERKGLLFAGSENGVYFSIDAGAHWQSLRLNMPCTSIRDLVVKNDDLVLGTHGRSFWILDNITPLRQLQNNTTTTRLLKPQTAMRIRWNMNPDTPLPPEEPAGENPPDGAQFDYYVQEANGGTISLEILNAKGELVRKYSSNDTLYKIPAVNIPLYWIRPQQILSNQVGAHRFLWDLKYTPLNIPASYPIAAVKNNTEPEGSAPWVMPGKYTAKLTYNGKVDTQSFEVVMDPRIKTSIKDLQRQHDLSMICYKGRIASQAKYPAIERKFTQLFEILKDADMAPTTTIEKEVLATQAAFEKLIK